MNYICSFFLFLLAIVNSPLLISGYTQVSSLRTWQRWIFGSYQRTPAYAASWQLRRIYCGLYTRMHLSFVHDGVLRAIVQEAEVGSVIALLVIVYHMDENGVVSYPSVER
jgi:hypothetical protein